MKRKTPNMPVSPSNLRLSDADEDFTCDFDYKSDCQSEFPNAKKRVSLMDVGRSPKRKKPNMVPVILFDQIFSDLEDDFTKAFERSDLHRKYLLGDEIGKGAEGFVRKAIHQQVVILAIVIVVVYLEFAPLNTHLIFLCELNTDKRNGRYQVRKKKVCSSPNRSVDSTITKTCKHLQAARIYRYIRAPIHGHSYIIIIILFYFIFFFFAKCNFLPRSWILPAMATFATEC